MHVSLLLFFFLIKKINTAIIINDNISKTVLEVSIFTILYFRKARRCIIYYSPFYFIKNSGNKINDLISKLLGFSNFLNCLMIIR